MDNDKQQRKRGDLLDDNKCIICQEENKLQKLVVPTPEGLKAINNATQVRISMELKWSNALYKETVIPCLGGLHIAVNFLGVIGKHMEDSGLCDLWVEADVLGANAAQNVKSGKCYNCAMRAHKLTLQALWLLHLPLGFCHLDSA